MKRLGLPQLLLLVAWSALAAAQVTTGTISGSVKDSSGGVLPNAKVVLQNDDTGSSRTVQSDNAGRYSAPALALGNYRVTASMEGFQAEARSGIVLTVGREAVVEFHLTVGAVSQTVEVAGEAPLVESTTSSLGSLVDDRTIRDLPLNGRSFDQLAFLQPGVIAMGGGTAQGSFNYGSGRRFSVAGSRSDTNSFLLDGTDINDQSNSTPGGSSGNNLGVDTIREFKILTNSFSAEYGRAAGSVTSAVTRSGTNGLHGSAFEYLRNSHLDARNFFDRGKTAPPFKRNQFGGVIGGPIQKDRTFFFGGYEGLRQGLGATQTSVVPTVASRQGVLPNGATVPINPAIVPYLAVFPLPTPGGVDFGDGTAQHIYAPTVVLNEDNYMFRVDHQLSGKTSLFLRYTHDRDGTNAPDVNDGFATVNIGRRHYSTIQANTILSASVINNARFAFNRTFQDTDDLPTISIPSSISFIPGQLIGTINVGGPSIGTGTSRTLTATGTTYATPRLFGYNLFEWGDDLTIIHGKHAVKTGAVIRRMRDNTSQNTGLKGQYTFPTFNSFLAGQPSNLAAVQVGQNAYRGFRQTMWGAYVQDDVTVNSRLTLNLGLRWEAISNPTEANGRISNIPTPLSEPVVLDTFFKIGKKNFEPRVGFAWRLDEKGSTVLRAGGGIFHNPVLPYVYAVNVAKIPPFYTLSSINNPNFPNGYQQLGTAAAKPQVFTIAPEIDLLTKYQYNLAIERQLGKSMVLEMAYIGARAYHIMRFSEQNYPTPIIRADGSKFYPAGAPRRNAALADIHWMTSDANALYNAGTVTIRRRSSSGLQFQAFYTLSRALDTISGTAGGDTQRDGSFSLDPDNIRRDWGPSDFHAKNNFVFNFTYPLPLHFASKLTQNVLGGWSINGIGTFTAGQPFTPRLANNQSRDGDNQNPDRPNLKPGASNNPILGKPSRWYDPSAFSQPEAGTYGNLGRNTVIGPGFANVDASIEKNFKAGERVDVLFRTEFFNIINHANFGLPNTTAITAAGAPNPQAGVITSTVFGNRGRDIQFGLKINF